MIREIVESAENTYTLNFPDELIGKKVEVIAFEIEDVAATSLSEIPIDKNKLQEINERYSKYPRISHDNYRFDRDEANDYE